MGNIMKTTVKYLKRSAITLSFCLLLIPLNANAQTGFWGVNAGCTGIDGESVLTSIVANLPIEEITIEEQNSLALMREREKLARDVYQVLYQTWGHEIFENIATSEQNHMNAVKALLDKYSLPDPVDTNPAGVFSDPTIQNLYDSLMTKGNISLVEAFKAGAEIEELAISDLNDLLVQTDNIDIQTVYQNLRKSARNHLRAFISHIPTEDPYVPQYLPAEELQEILNANLETGMYDQDGEPAYGHDGLLTFEDTDGDGLCDSVDSVARYTREDLDNAYLQSKQLKKSQRLKTLRNLKQTHIKYKKIIQALNLKIKRVQN